jgi:RHS repeat-associated protein
VSRATRGSTALAACLCAILSLGSPLTSSQELPTPAPTVPALTTPVDTTPAPVNQPTTPSWVTAEPQAEIPSGVAVGRTRGSFGVARTGAAQYVIPLWTPRGIAGLQPSLALAYSSQSGDGAFGVGWNLAGVSNIARCSKTDAQDGIAAQVFLTSADLYCLDGNKLRMFSGTYGADGSQYQTELADFSLIISHGTAGTGPAWFEVHAKNGLIYQFGNTANSALLATGTASVIQWAVNRISDQFGNHIDFTYTNDATNQVLVPSAIVYTTPPAGASGVQTTPNYQIQFTFQSRTTPVPSGFITGAQFMEPYLGQTIAIQAWTGSAYVTQLTYNLTYTAGSATGRSTLTSVQECSTTQCYPATTIGYQGGQKGWGSAVATGGHSTGLWQGIVGDINGDGIDDIVYQDSSTGEYAYLLGSTSGTYSGPYNTGITGSVPVPMDFYANGKVDVLTVNSSGNWRVWAFSTAGSEFTYADTTIAAPTSVWGFVTVGDVDGDGRDDLIYAVSSGSSWTSPDYIYYRLNTGGGLGPQQLLAQIGSSTCASSKQCQKLLNYPFGEFTAFNSRLRRADVNGDGRTDFFVDIKSCTLNDGTCTTPSYAWQLFVSDALSNTYDALDVVNYGATGLASNLFPPLFGDFNGDGCTDVASNRNGIWYIQYGTCLRSGAVNALSAAVDTGAPAYGIFPMAMDWDGDGRDDIVEPNATSGGYIGYSHSTGTGLTAWTSAGIAYSNADTLNNAILVVDVYGDGHYGFVYPTGSGHAMDAWPHNGKGIDQDLATSFADGFGYAYNPTYTQLTNSTYYNNYIQYYNPPYPEQVTSQPITVVANYTASDGTGGTYSVGEFYFNARLNIAGRGFEGFYDIRSLDSRNSLYTNTYYSQLFPETGMVSETTLSTSSKAYASVVNTNTSDTLDSTNKRYFPYVSQSVSSQYEYGGTLDGTLITQVTKAYTYGGANGFTYGNLSKITTTMVDKDPTSPWTGQTFTDIVNITPYEQGFSNGKGWCIHLSSGGSEQRTQPSNATLTHTTSSVVNQNGYCETDSTTVEPSSTTDKVLTAYLYDSCGNIKSMSVTGQTPGGTAMAARTTTISYGSHCIRPETVTNALTQSTLIGYNYNLGLKTSVTDPNNLATTWTYNDIGQKTLEQRPDGTETSYLIALCPTCASPPFTEYNVTIQQLDSTSSHTAFHTEVDGYDQLDRLTAALTILPDQYVVFNETVFDSQGRVSQTASPYFVGATVYFTTDSYDLLNRLTTTSRPISATNPSLEYTYYTYQGRTATVKDPKGYTTTKQSDVIGELEIVTDPDGTSKTNYAYDPFSHLVQIKDPASNTTTRTYDALGYLLTASSDPDRGAWTFQDDSLGELINLRDAKTTAPAWTQQLSYDALGRMTQRVEPEGTGTWTWGTVASNHEIGKIKEVSGLGDDELYTYDSAGRLSQHSMTWSGITYTVGYNYNTLGKLNQLIYPLANGQTNPFTVLYGYTQGWLTSLENYTGGVAGTTFWELTPGGTNIDPWGHVVDETLGTTTPVRIQSSYDAVDGWMNTRTAGSGGSLNNIQNLSYQWDLNGNLNQREDVNQSVTEAITYDNLNRIQSSTLNGTANLSVVIDNTGNITSRTEGGTTYPYTYDTAHKHAVATVGSVGTYTYDANGNQATRNGNTLTWASFNLPTVIPASGGVSANFTYGPDHQRKQQTAVYVSDGDSGTETTTYVFGLYEFENTPAQQHNKYFIQVPGSTQIIYDIQSVSGAQTTYITADHLGSAAAFLNSSGSVQIDESYSAYGNRRTSNWSGPLPATSGDYTIIASTTRRGYTDGFHETLDNVALIHMNGRVYDPIAGRFLSPDPVVTQVGDSQRGNPYSYVSNRPLTLSDPTGLTTHGQCIDICGFGNNAPRAWGCGPGCFDGGAGAWSAIGAGAVSDTQWAASEVANEITNALGEWAQGEATGVSQMTRAADPGDNNNTGSSGGSDSGSTGSSGGSAPGSTGSSGGSDPGSVGSSGGSDPGGVAPSAGSQGSTGSPAAQGSEGGEQLQEVVVVAYQGKYHDQLVSQITVGMQAAGWTVVNEFTLCMEGGPCTRADVFGRSPQDGKLYVLEVKTGKDPSFTPNQLAVYPHLSAGGLVVSPDPRIVQFGWPLDTPLPSISGGLLYQPNSASRPVYVPFP